MLNEGDKINFFMTILFAVGSRFKVQGIRFYHPPLWQRGLGGFEKHLKSLLTSL